MLTFNLKKEWFEKIKSGEKTHEYRLKNNYWFKRLFSIWYKLKHKDYSSKEQIQCIFACGYPKRTDISKRLKAEIKSITIRNGLDTDLKINKDVYDIEFELIKGVDIDSIVDNTVHIQKIGDVIVKNYFKVNNAT